MKVEIWFDFICPFCYMGEKKFELALANFEHKEEVEIVYRSFQLNMAPESTKGKDIHQVIADKYNISYKQAKENNDSIVQAASEVGLNYRFDILKLNSTELAHEICHYAKENNKGNSLVNRYFKGYFEEGLDIGNKEKLLELAMDAGLNIGDLNSQLENGSLKSEVQQDEAMARKLGINSVPHFVINNKFVVSGAQNPATFLTALKKAYKDGNENS